MENLTIQDRYEELLSKVNIADDFGMSVEETQELINVINLDTTNINNYFYVIAYAFAVGHQRGQAQKRQELNNLALKGAL